MYMCFIEYTTVLTVHIFIWGWLSSKDGEGNGNPLQCSCLENPRDWGAWWAAVYGVAQSRTRLKPLSSNSKESTCNVGDLGLIPRMGRSAGEGTSYPLQYSGLENSTDRRAWQATVHRIAESQTWRSDFHFIGSSAAKESLQCRKPQLDSWVGKIPWRRDRIPTSVFMVFTLGSDRKEFICNLGDLGSIPGSGWSTGGGMRIPMDRGDWQAIVHGVTKSQTWLSD